MKRVVISSDRHVPYHDPLAHDLQLRFLQEFRPDLYVENGDHLDCYQLSKFDRDPKRRFRIAEDMTLAQSLLENVRQALPATTRRVFLDGNHEDRLRRFIWDKAPELLGLKGMSIDEQLELSAHGWEHIPYYNPVEAVGAPGLAVYGLLILHGIFARKASGATAKAHFERFMVNGICGHSHRQGDYLHRAWGGEYVWMEGGCMCKLEPPYMASPDWQQGFIAGYVWDEPDNPNPRFDLHRVVIHNRKLAWEGRLLRA